MLNLIKNNITINYLYLYIIRIFFVVLRTKIICQIVSKLFTDLTNSDIMKNSKNI